MLKSIRARYVAPLALVASAAVASGVWAGYSALVTVRSVIAAEQTAYEVAKQIKEIDAGLAAAAAVVADVRAMRRLIDIERAVAGFEASADRVLQASGRLRQLSFHDDMVQAIAELQALARLWQRDAALILGTQRLSVVPTAERYHRREQAVRSALEHVAEQFHHDTVNRLATTDANLRRTMLGATAVFALALTASIGVAFLIASNTARRVVGVAAALRELADANGTGRPGREFEQMDAALETLRKSLAEKAELAERAHYHAYFDSLTGLANRVRFIDATEELLARGTAACLVMVDLDGFKEINDRLGHAAGDLLLTEVGQRLAALTGEMDGAVAARLGGDEFALIFPGLATREAAEQICADLMTLLRRPAVRGGLAVAPRGSLGVALSVDVEPCAIDALMAAADMALYQAKALGRNTWSVFDRKLSITLMKRRELEDALPGALENSEFEIRLQPQFVLANGRLHGFEALIRWRHGDVLLSPAEFLPIAEDNGLIVEIDYWVVRKVVRLIARWGAAGLPPVSISVNLSALHFRSDDIIEQVATAIGAAGIDPRLLTLEIRESHLMENRDDVTARLDALGRIGVELSLDDFGSGQSSFAHLRKLGIDEIKIDRSFLAEIESSEETRFVLDGLADIAARLGLRVLVEGIETEAQCEVVTGIVGIELGQGFHLGAPMSEIAARVLVEQIAGEHPKPLAPPAGRRRAVRR